MPKPPPLKLIKSPERAPVTVTRVLFPSLITYCAALAFDNEPPPALVTLSDGRTGFRPLVG